MAVFGGILLLCVLTACLVAAGGLMVIQAMEPRENISVVVVPRSAEDCEYTVRMAAKRMKWFEPNRDCRLICLNVEDDPEINALCNRLSFQYPYLQVSNFQDIGYNMVHGNH